MELLKIMESRHRVKRAVHFQVPDRVPLQYMIGLASQLKYGQVVIDLLNNQPDDFGNRPRLQPREEWAGYFTAGDFVDEWGVKWHNEIDGIIGMPVGYPLSDWSNLQSFKPRACPSDEWLISYDEELKKNGHNHFDILFPPYDLQLFERMHYLCGFEKVLMELAVDSMELRKLRDILHQRNLEVYQKLIETSADCLYFQDDWGTQNGLLISPQLWRQYFKPCYAELFDLARRAGKDIYFHSDGNIWDIIGDLVDIGVTILNVQDWVIGRKRLGREFKGRVCFCSTVDCQFVLPHSSREEIFEDVRDIIENLGSKSGGVIGIIYGDADTPLENIAYSLEAWKNLGLKNNGS